MRKKTKNLSRFQGPRFESGISRAYACLAAHPGHRHCVSHSSERSLQADSVDTLFLSEKKKVPAESFVSLHFIFPCHHTDYDHLLLSPNTPFPLFFSLHALGLASMDLPPRILHVRECSEIFGHVLVACQPRAASGTIGGYLKHCRQMLLPPLPPLNPAPGQRNSDKPTVYTGSDIGHISVQQMSAVGYNYLFTNTLLTANSHVSKFPEFYAICQLPLPCSHTIQTSFFKLYAR